jgi:hypothetical protein
MQLRLMPRPAQPTMLDLKAPQQRSAVHTDIKAGYAVSQTWMRTRSSSRAETISRHSQRKMR